ncbi:MAG TPA: hypothetical protein VFS20_19105 [Longimicrobium sp.]|nr:hypothetical protein [Longimicrobium sp.]
MRRSLRACALLLSGLLLAGCDDLSFVDDNIGCDQVRSFSLGSDTSGSLDPGDCRLNDGSAVDFYRFRINSSRDVFVNMQSNSITPYVAILDEFGSVVAEEDFGDAGYSELTVFLPSGTYYIAASSYSAGDYGSYFMETDDNF